jgi:hypothetical protein
MKNYLIILLFMIMSCENRLQAMDSPSWLVNEKTRKQHLEEQIEQLDKIIARNEQAARNPGQLPPFIVWMLDERNRKQPGEKQKESAVKQLCC